MVFDSIAVSKEKILEFRELLKKPDSVKGKELLHLSAPFDTRRSDGPFPFYVFPSRRILKPGEFEPLYSPTLFIVPQGCENDLETIIRAQRHAPEPVNAFTRTEIEGYDSSPQIIIQPLKIEFNFITASGLDKECSPDPLRFSLLAVQYYRIIKSVYEEELEKRKS